MQCGPKLDKLLIGRGVLTVEFPASCIEDLKVVVLGVSIQIGVRFLVMLLLLNYSCIL